MKKTFLLSGLIVSIFATSAFALLDASDFQKVVGYVVYGTSNVVDEFEGGDFGKLVKLDNGMIFEFNEFHYTYAYRPGVAIFARQYTVEGKDSTLISWKLLIEDHIYDVSRIK